MDGVQDILREHGRRYFSVRAVGLLPFVCPIDDGSDVCGACIMTVDVAAAAEIMGADPLGAGWCLI
jgi:hypothetical protein